MLALAVRIKNYRGLVPSWHVARSLGQTPHLDVSTCMFCTYIDKKKLFVLWSFANDDEVLSQLESIGKTPSSIMVIVIWLTIALV